MRRVVVTGLGTINPLGNSVEKSWNSLISSKSCISKITKFETDNYPCKIAGSIDDTRINTDIVSPRDQRKIDRFITLGLIAAEEAIKDSGFVSENEKSFRSGGHSGLPTWHLSDRPRIVAARATTRRALEIAPLHLAAMLHIVTPW